MSFKPYHQIAGVAPQPQFFLKDRGGREYGVVEHYETDRSRPSGFVLLEFFSPDPALTQRPLVWLDLKAWAVVVGKGKNLPDADFEPGLDAYLQGFPPGERETRSDRARRAQYHEIIRLAEQGYTVAYQEMFPGELTREDFPAVEIAGRHYLVDDQYLIQPGDFRHQVTLVFIASPLGNTDATHAPAEPALLCNWLFGVGYEILATEIDERLCHAVLKPLTENPELEKIYKQRLIKMRREGTLLGLKPKPYAPPSAPADGSAPRP